jgi:ABC-type glycerol-3-phosphate transport system substrate-binding protein
MRPTSVARRFDARARAALIALLFVVAACAFVPATTASVTTLVVWVDTPAIGASIRSRVGQFKKEHPTLDVKVFDQAQKIQNGDVSISIEALTNTTLSPDVVALTATDFRLMSNRSDLLDLAPYFITQSDFNTDDFFPTVLDAFRDRGKQYAVPSELVPWVIFYNKQLFDTAKVALPDSTWSISQFAAAAQQVQLLSRDKQEVVGFVTDPTVALVPFATTFGATPQDATDDPNARWLEDRQTIAAAQWLVDLGLRQKVLQTDPNNRSLGFWYSGRAAMVGAFMDQRNVTPQFFERDRELTPTPTGTVTGTPPPSWRFSWGVAMVPKAEVRSSVYYVSGYGIPSTSKNPDQAWTLIDYLSRNLPDQPVRAYVPARESLAYSKEYADLFPDTGRGAYLQTIEYGHRVPAWPSNANPTYEDLQGMLDGSVNPSSGLLAYRDRVQPILIALAQRPTIPYTPTPGAPPGPP